MSGSRDWTPAFEGQRPPRRAGDPAAFKPGNDLAVKHGAYSSALEDSPRVLELCEELRAVAPWLQPADELALRLLAANVVHFERASAVMLPTPVEGSDVDEWATRVKASTLSRDARGWLSQATKLAHELGLTPAGRAEIEEREGVIIYVDQAKELVDALTAIAAEFVDDPAGSRDERRARFLELLERVRPLPSPRYAIEASVVDPADAEPS